ncbi:hypothetical protein [Fulvimarina sp. MAC3]|uniref:hypothetical protein n=1 Tax=Fulvimarina sp. MAC3 TaxID=3148887 RepID=UPI0031FE36BB
MPTATLQYLIALSISFACAGTIIAILYRPLLRVIVDLCGSEERGRLWTVYAGVMIMLAPVLAVSVATTTGSFVNGDPLFLQNCIFWSTGALMSALAILGVCLWQPSSRLFDARQDERERQFKRPLDREAV